MYILASKNDYHSNFLFDKLKNSEFEWIFITEKDDLTLEKLEKINVQKIFFLHWSYIVPKNIYNTYECINFHTGNLPNGKGGSPLQNQIIDEILSSKVNALKMSDDGLDAGPIYISENITLQGNLFDIWLTITKLVLPMILKIIKDDIKPIAQEENKSEIYKRRKENNIPFDKTDNLEKIYDFIRMLDDDKYPDPYLEIGNFNLKFSRASFNGNRILSDVTIEKKKN